MPREFDDDPAAGAARHGEEHEHGLLRRRDAAVVDRAVRAFFDPEFLNRLDEVVRFDEISPATAADIVRLRLEDVLARFRRRDVELLIGDGVVETLVRLGFDSVHGARGLARTVRGTLVVAVADALVRHRHDAACEGQPLRLRVDPGDAALVVSAADAG